MPTYDYECRACGEKLEIFHGINEPARKKCPKCGKSKLERLIGAGSGFIFKGSGFYITDYRSSDYQAKAKADGGGSTAAETGSKTPADKGASDGGGASKPAAEAKPASSGEKSSKPAAPEPKPKGGAKAGSSSKAG